MIPGIVSADRTLIESLGESVVFETAEGSIPIKAIFDVPDMTPRPELAEVELEVSRPQALCIASDVISVKRGNVCIRGNERHKVIDVFFDGLGLASVVLI